MKNIIKYGLLSTAQIGLNAHLPASIESENSEIISISSRKIEKAKIVAEKLAKKAKEKKITKIYFDRGIYKYHGRVKIFAETLRKNGMDF